jgi:hypothetical protein
MRSLARPQAASDIASLIQILASERSAGR